MLPSKYAVGPTTCPRVGARPLSVPLLRYSVIVACPLLEAIVSTWAVIVPGSGPVTWPFSANECPGGPKRVPLSDSFSDVSLDAVLARGDGCWAAAAVAP